MPSCECASHHRSLIRVIRHAVLRRRYAPCCVHGRGGCMQVVSGRGCPRRPRKGVSKLRMLGNGRKRLCLWFGFIREYIDTETKNRIDTETKNRIDPYRCDYWLPCGYGLAAPSGSSQHCCRPVESQRHSTSTAVGVRAPCPLRRSLLAFGIEPGQPRDARTPGTRTHGRVAARSTEPRATRSTM